MMPAAAVATPMPIMLRAPADQSLETVNDSAFDAGIGEVLAGFAQERLQRPLGEQHKQHEQRGVVGRQARRQALHRQTPDQHHHRQQIIETGLDGRTRLGQLGDLHRGFEFREIARILRPGRHRRSAISSEATHKVASPKAAFIQPRPKVDDRRQHDGQADESRQAKLISAANEVAPDSAAGKPLHVGLQGLEVHDVDQRHVGDQRRQAACLITST